jgi:ribosomal protein S18 acetylase RimI-like enzyme
MDLHCRKPYGPEIQLQEITDAGLVTLLADIDGELAGFAQLRLRAPQPCIPATNPMELSRLYVAKSWHGCGVAQRLMHRVLETVQSQRCTDLWLGVWERNARALAFYRKFGFTMVGEHVFTVGTDPQRDLILHFRP